MADSPNPFSVYDFLGYMIPGLYLILMISLVLSSNPELVLGPKAATEVHSAEGANAVNGKSEIAANSDPLSLTDKAQKESEKSWVWDTGIIPKGLEQNIILVIFAYLAGHISSFLSSITIEKYSHWTLGYPRRYLIEDLKTRYYHRGNKPHRTSSRVTITESRTKDDWWFKILLLNFMRLVNFAILMPISLFDIVARRWLGMRLVFAKPLDPPILKELRDDLHIEDISIKQLYHYLISSRSPHLPRISNYHALYGFLRNTCFVSIFVAWILFFRQLLAFGGLLQDVVYYFLIVSLALVSVVLYLSYNKFMRKFTAEIMYGYAFMRREAD